MVKSKLFSFLRTLDKHELSAFGKYLFKNYGKHDTAIALFRYLKPFHPNYRDDQKLDINFVYHALFDQQAPDGEINRVKLLNALSDLFLWLKAFLLHQKATSNSIQGELLWFDILTERGREKEAAKQFTFLKAQMDSSGLAESPLYFKKLTISYLDCYKIPKKNSTQEYKALQNCLSDLNALYALIRLKLTCEMVNRQKMTAVKNMTQKKKPDDMTALFDFSSSFLEANPLIHAYYEAYHLIVGRDSKKSITHFESILSLLKQHDKTIALEEKNTLLAYLHNYSIHQIRAENKVFFIRAHELDVYSLEQGVYTLKGLISPFQYINIVAIACRAREFTWAEQFIKDYISKVDRSERNRVKSLSIALVAFWKKEYLITQEILNKCNFANFQYTIRSKPLLLASYYELTANTDYSLVIDTCSAFERQLNRHKELKGPAIKGMFNFSRILKKMALRNTEKDLLLKEIKKTKPLFLKEWLLEKATVYP